LDVELGITVDGFQPQQRRLDDLWVIPPVRPARNGVVDAEMEVGVFTALLDAESSPFAVGEEIESEAAEAVVPSQGFLG
jgi:hypothetical protein